MKFKAFDIETFVGDDGRLFPYCLCYSLGFEIKTLYGLDCIKIFVEILWNLKDPCVLYAHNLTFDSTYIFQELSKKDTKLNSLMLDCSVYYINFLNGYNILVTLKCSFKMLPISLKYMNKILDVGPKGEFEHKKVNRENYANFKDEVTLYCKQDVKLCLNILNIIDVSLKITNFNWNDNSYSISSVSINIFKKFFNTHNVSLKTSLDMDERIRPSYCGGRTEVFGNVRPKERVLHFDFVGMYAQTMREKYPYDAPKYICKPEKIEKFGFYQISFTSNMSIPVLPYRDPLSKKLLFPNGSVKGFYWSEEINYFVSCGGKVDEIHWGYVFKTSGFVFRDFSNYMAKRRLDSKNSKFIFKLINNSLYGRLGMSAKNEETRLLSIEAYERLDPKTVIKCIKINKYAFVKFKRSRIKNSVQANVILASIITSKGRIKLHKGYKNVENFGGRLLYSDTDSIIAAFDYENDVLDKTMGDVLFDSKNPETEIIDSVFILPKTYGIRYKDGTTKIKIKGIYKPKISLEELKEKFYCNDNISFKQDILTHKKNYFFEEVSILKLIDLNNYNKRTFSPDKKTTSPIRL